MLHTPNRLLFLVLTTLLAATVAAAAQDEVRVERVHFAKGANSAVIEGSITGYETVDYTLGARKGQYMNVSMTSNNGANYFNILAPGETEVALFNGSMSENQFEGVLPATGDYKVRVYLMRSAARRKEVAKYRLEMIIGSGEAPEPRSAASPHDALVAGTPYHATGAVPCSMGGGQPAGSCPFGVIRTGNGAGTVTVTKPDGRTRSIFFEDGRATGCDASGADRVEFHASHEGDLSIVRIGDERYEIPDAVIQGG